MYTTPSVLAGFCMARTLTDSVHFRRQHPTVNSSQSDDSIVVLPHVVDTLMVSCYLASSTSTSIAVGVSVCVSVCVFVRSYTRN